MRFFNMSFDVECCKGCEQCVKKKRQSHITAWQTAKDTITAKNNFTECDNIQLNVKSLSQM